VAIRNVATIGGNLCNASPSGELSQAMMALSATIRIIGPRGERELPIEDFFQGVGLTALANDEIMAGIEAPILSPNARGAYAKHSPRGSIDLAIVNVGILLTPSDTDQSCRDVRIALGAVASTPMRARKAELLLKGEKISPRLIERVAEQAADESDPRPDTLGSVEYKKEMVRVYVARLIGRLASQMVH
jgi:carbon-monoxide dehydrogenase medium subunit